MKWVKNENVREKLSTVRCFLLDMDGTFYLGDRLIDGSLEFLEALKKMHEEYCARWGDPPTKEVEEKKE